VVPLVLGSRGFAEQSHARHGEAQPCSSTGKSREAMIPLCGSEAMIRKRYATTKTLRQGIPEGEHWNPKLTYASKVQFPFGETSY